MEVLFVVSPFNKREIDENRFVIFLIISFFWFQGVVGPLAKLGTIEKVRKTTYIVRRDPGGDHRPDGHQGTKLRRLRGT